MILTSLPSTSDFDAVFAAPDSKAGNSDFLILARHSAVIDIDRLGFVTSKKKIKRAVDRNRFRRVIRDCFRRNLSKRCGFDYVVIARKVPDNLWTNQFNANTAAIIHKLFRRLEPNDPQR